MSLKTKLIELIKQQGKVHWKDLERFCTQNEHRWADNGSKRMREVRQKGHPNYDPHIGVIYYHGTETIEYYTYDAQTEVTKQWFKDFPKVEAKQPQGQGVLL